MENEKFVTILTATYGSEIAVVRGRLESEGISEKEREELLKRIKPTIDRLEARGVKFPVETSEKPIESNE